eukprot:13351945-Heterocapsa_arctica.AAC.1
MGAAMGRLQTGHQEIHLFGPSIMCWKAIQISGKPSDPFAVPRSRPPERKGVAAENGRWIDSAAPFSPAPAWPTQEESLQN